MRLQQVATNSEKSRQYSRDFSIENAERRVISDSEYGGCGVASDAGELQSGIQLARKFSFVMQKDFSCGAVQVACAAVIPQAGPEFQNFREWCASERFHIRQPMQKTLVVRHYGGDARLLQHHFRDPDAVRIAACPPGKVAFVRAKPAQQSPLKILEL